MAKRLRFQKLKGTFEALGMIAVIISLILVWQEMRQNRVLSEISFEMTITQNKIIANQTIANNADVWFRGCANDSLSANEELIFQAMIEDKNELAFYRVNRYYHLNDESSAKVIEADFIGFLHRNPGARKVWRTHEEAIIANRAKLDVHLVDVWYKNIVQGLQQLDNLTLSE